MLALGLMPTMRCNRGCPWCGCSSTNTGDSMSREQIDDLAKILEAISPKIRFTNICVTGGGEPLMHPDVGYIFEKLRLHSNTMNLVTSGPNDDVEKKRLEEVMSWFGTDGKTNRVFLSLYNNRGSLERLNSALPMLRGGSILRFLCYLGDSELDICRYLDELEQVMNDNGFFQLCTISDSRDRPILNKQKVWSASHNRVFVTPLNPREMLSNLYDHEKNLVYLNVVNGKIMSLSLNTVASAGRARNLEYSVKNSMCVAMSKSSTTYLFLDPNGVRVCHSGVGGYSEYQEIPKLVSRVEPILEEVRRRLIANPETEYGSLCDICYLSAKPAISV